MDQYHFFKIIKYLSFNNSLYNINLPNINYTKKIEDEIIKYENLEKYFEKDNLKIIKFIYYNKDYIHDILYEKEEDIKLINVIEKDYLSYYFYLCLLIRDRNDIHNYKYDFKYIGKIIDIYKKINGKYIKLIFSKIILELINNYNQFDDIEEIYSNEYNQIIKNNINNFNEFDLNLNEDNFINDNIDKVYIDIIIDLIKNKKFEENEYILKELEIEKINMTKNMIDKIKNNENLFNEYLISKIEDLYNNKKINFYYLLTKYILKNNIFIYQINFLLITRNNIIKIIRQNPNNLLDNIIIKDKNNKERLEAFLKFILDSKYYIDKYINLNNNNSINSNISSNDNRKNNKENCKINFYQNSLNCLNSLNSNYTNSISSDINESSSNKKIISKLVNSNTSNIEESSSSQNISNIINSEMNKLSLNTYLIDNNNSIKNNNNIRLEENYGQIENSLSSFIGIKTTKHKERKKEKEYYYLIQYKKIIYPIKKEEYKRKGENNFINYTIDYIKEINNIFFCYGAMNSFIRFDEGYNYLKDKIDEHKEWVKNIVVMKNNDIHDILIGHKKGIDIYTLEKKHLKMKEFRKFNDKLKINGELVLFIKAKNQDFYICSEYEMKLLKDFSSKIISDNNLINTNNNDLYFKGAIKIKDFLIFKSNKIISRGKDKLKIFNINSGKFIDNKQIKEEYSFIMSSGGIVSFPIENDDLNIENKRKGLFNVVLFACKKYIKSQKNGILVLILGNNLNNINYYFYNTSNFEVYCFCPILLIESINISSKERKIIDTEYFLVGGYEPKKHKGIIKLFKIIYNENKIEYIEDIKFDDDNYKRFRGPISCITQSSSDGKLLISCWDGNIYLFDSPKINNYLENDKKNKDNISLEEFFCIN